MLKQIKILPVSLYLFSAGWLGSAISLLGSVLLVGWSLVHLRQVLRDLSGCKLCWLSLLAIGYLLLHFYFLDSGIELQKPSKQLKGHIILWLFPLIGYAIYRSKIPVRWLLLAAAIGLIFRIVVHTDWMHFSDFIKARQGFGLAIIGLGLYAGITMVGLLVFIRRFWRVHEKAAVFQITIWWLMVIFAAFGWLLALSRGAWVATFCGLIVALILWLRTYDVKSALKQHRGIWVSAAILVVLFSTLGYAKFIERLFAESDVYADVLSLDRDRIPYSSVGVRAHMLIYGVEKWRERIWLGWGQGSTRTILDQDVGLGKWPHFHNSYIQILVELGLVGFMLYATALALMLSGLWRSLRSGNMPLDVFIFLTTAWVMVLVWSLFDTRMVHVDERFLLLMLSAAGLSYILRQTLPDLSITEEKN